MKPNTTATIEQVLRLVRNPDLRPAHEKVLKLQRGQKVRLNVPKSYLDKPHGDLAFRRAIAAFMSKSLQRYPEFAERRFRYSGSSFEPQWLTIEREV